MRRRRPCKHHGAVGRALASERRIQALLLRATWCAPQASVPWRTAWRASSATCRTGGALRSPGKPRGRSIRHEAHVQAAYAGIHDSVTRRLLPARRQQFLEARLASGGAAAAAPAQEPEPVWPSQPNLALGTRPPGPAQHQQAAGANRRATQQPQQQRRRTTGSDGGERVKSAGVRAFTRACQPHEGGPPHATCAPRPRVQEGPWAERSTARPRGWARGAGRGGYLRRPWWAAAACRRAAAPAAAAARRRTS